MRPGDERQERPVALPAALRTLLAVILSIPVVVIAPLFIGLVSLDGDTSQVLIAVAVVAALLTMIWLVCT